MRLVLSGILILAMLGGTSEGHALRLHAMVAVAQTGKGTGEAACGRATSTSNVNPTPTPPSSPAPSPTPSLTPQQTPLPTAAPTSVAVLLPTVDGTPMRIFLASGQTDDACTIEETVRDNIVIALRLNGYDAEPVSAESAINQPRQYTIVTKLVFDAYAKSAGGPQHASVLLSVHGADFSQLGSVRTIDLTGKVLTTTTITNTDISTLLDVGKPARSADVVILSDGVRDEQTANTAFSGPAYVEARLEAELLRFGLLGATPSEFLGSNQSVTLATNSDVEKQVCKLDPGIWLVRYAIGYDQNVNYAFGTQNATADLGAVAYKCYTPEDKWSNYEVSLASHAFGSAGSFSLLTIVPLYFKLTNFALSSIRNNPNWRGLFGTSGDVSTSLLPRVDANAALTMAVGRAADRVACSFVLDRLQERYPADFVTARNEAETSTAALFHVAFYKHPMLKPADFVDDPCKAATLIATQLRSVIATASPNRGASGSAAAAPPTMSPMPKNLLRTFVL